MDCVTQSQDDTPRPVWSPDTRQPIDFLEGWDAVADSEAPANGFRVQWEMFLRHVYEDAEWDHNLFEGAKGLQLAELG